MKNSRLAKNINKIILVGLALLLCICMASSAMVNELTYRVGALGGAPQEMTFGWDGEDGLAKKLDNSSSSFNAKRGQTYGSDTILANADGGLTNAALVGNGSIGGVFGGTSAGQSINIGANDFWNGEYDSEKVLGIKPQTVGSVGYNIIDPNNKSNADIDLATTFSKVTASSSEDGFPASAAFSGDYVSNAFWGMGWWSLNGQGANSWLKLEFDKAITFSRIALWNAGSCMLDAGYDMATNVENWNTNSFNIEVSTDGVTWTKVYEELDNYQPIYDRDLTTPATGKFVRLNIVKPCINDDNRARICKFSLFEEKKNDLNLMPTLVNGSGTVDKGLGIVTSSTKKPDPGQDAPHIYTCSNLYATVCGTQQHLAGYGNWGYGWYTDNEPKGDWIQYALNKRTTFKSYQLFNGSASTANAFNRGDWRGWTVSTSKTGAEGSWKDVHTVDVSNLPEISGGQPAICSFDIPDDKLADCVGVKYIKLTISMNTNDSSALLSQFKIYAGTLAESGIVATNEATFTQNIKEGKVGATCTYGTAVTGGQKYSSHTSFGQRGENYMVTEFVNSSNAPLNMRYYTSAHHYRNADETQYSSVTPDNKILYSTRTTQTAAPKDLAWVSSATLAARIEGDTAWTNTVVTAGASYGDFTIPAGGTIRIVAYVDCRQYNDKTPGYENIVAKGAPTQAIALGKLLPATNGATIIADSTAWWKEFWLKSYIDVYDKTVEKFYYNSLYIVGSASREDNVPSSLFGPFTTSDSMSWGGTYVADYNLYGAYMAVAASNRADLLKPLVRNAMEAWGGIEGVGNGIGTQYGDKFNEATNNKFTNADGSFMFKNGVDGVLNAVVSAPHGYACDMGGFYKILFTCAYMALPVVSYADMTQGTGEITEGVILTPQIEYDYLKDVMALWEQILIYENGVYKVKYDGAWENEPNNMGNAFSLAGIHTFTKRLVERADQLGITEEDEPRIMKWKHINANLEPYPTAMVTDKHEDHKGKVRLCYSDTLTSAQKGHVTYNGNTGNGKDSNPNVVVAQVIPTGELGLYSNPADKAIMRNSLATIKSWNNINAMPTIFSTAARVGYASETYGNRNSREDLPSYDRGVTTLMQQLRKSANGGMVQNNISNLPDPLQLIDTCGGAQGVNDILVQTFSYVPSGKLRADSITTVFPAYEADKAAKFVNLQSKGGFLVSASQNASGQVTFLKVTSQYGATTTSDGRFTLAIPKGYNWKIVDSTGADVALTRSNVGALVGYSAYDAVKTISFATEKGKSYYMVEIPANSGAQSSANLVANNAIDLPRKED